MRFPYFADASGLPIFADDTGIFLAEFNDESAAAIIAEFFPNA
jgi:inosine/xanthosine triphosphate pyrophosphatase family protein